MNPIKMTIQTTVKAPLDMVWKIWTTPEDIIQWNSPSKDWQITRAKNDLRVGGKFIARMETKDRSDGFEFESTYNKIHPSEHIHYTMGDGRKVWIDFSAVGNETKIEETFETENEYSLDQQREGWQAVLDNFKKYVENKTHNKSRL